MRLALLGIAVIGAVVLVGTGVRLWAGGGEAADDARAWYVPPPFSPATPATPAAGEASPEPSPPPAGRREAIYFYLINSDEQRDLVEQLHAPIAEHIRAEVYTRDSDYIPSGRTIHEMWALGIPVVVVDLR